MLCMCRQAECEWCSGQRAISTNVFSVGGICLLCDFKMSVYDYQCESGGWAGIELGNYLS